jgi:hypothetical protein
MARSQWQWAVLGLAIFASQAQGQTAPSVQAQVTYPSTATVQAGDEIAITVIARVAADAAGEAQATVDPMGIGRSTFVMRLMPTSYVGSDACPAGAQCFYASLATTFRLTPGAHQIPVAVTDSKGRRGSGAGSFTSTPARDDDHDGLPDAWAFEVGLTGGPDDDPDGDGISTRHEFLADTNPMDKYTRLFAEGSSGEAQPLQNCVVYAPMNNPDTAPGTSVRVVSVGDNGRVAITRGYVGNYPSGACPLQGAVADRIVEMRVESMTPLAVERTTTSGMTPSTDERAPAQAQPANASLGMQEPSRTWTFADGHTADGIDMFLLLFNPSGGTITADLTYVRAPSTVVAHATRALPPGVRTTIWVNQDQPDALGGDVSVLINANAPILAERAFRYRSPGRTVPHDSVTRGAWQTATRWYFPDMDSRGPFASSLVLMNPSSLPTRATITTALPSGASAHVEVALTAGERRELTLRDLPAPAGTTFGAVVESANGIGIVAERVASGVTESGAWRRAAIGTTQSGTSWVLPTSNSLVANETDLVVMNVSDFPARVRVKMRVYDFECCSVSEGSVDIPPRGAVHLPLGFYDPNRTVAVLPFGMMMVESVANSSGATAQIVVERTNYWDQDGVHHGRASSVLANQVQ